jgi:hypothetical protein
MEEGGSTELVANGTFDSDDITNWSVLSWTGQTLKVAEDATTGIQQIQADHDSVTGAVYDLQGRKIDDKQLVPGIYVTKKKKFIVK